MDPPYFYVREKSSAAAHHWDYLRDRTDHALCGHGYLDPITLGEVSRPKAVCRACQALLPKYQVAWWRQQAKDTDGELQNLRAEYRELKKHAENQRQQLANLQNAMYQAKHGSPPRPPVQRRALSPRIETPRKPKRTRRPPPIRVVRGGAPGLGKRR